MSKKTYKISLQPLGPFFFGSERTYGPNNAVYFAISNRYPQQTALLGMLRFRLLEMRGWLNNNAGKSAGSYDDRKSLIGKRSFKAEDAKKIGDFGAVKNLSPVWVEHQQDLLLPGALNKGYRLKTSSKKENEIQWETIGEGFSKPYLPVVENFNYKNAVSSHLLATKSVAIKEYDDVFISGERIGITKEGREENDRDGFYKQEHYRFPNDTQFVFYATFSKAEGEELAAFVDQVPQIQMGGERSNFHMKMIEATPDWKCLNAYEKMVDLDPTNAQLVLLGDAYVEPSTIYHSRFTIGETNFFRHIQTSTKETVNFHSHPKNGTGFPIKSAGFNLLQRGSVIYLESEKEDKEQLLKYLTNQAIGWQQIGYNYFALIENETITPILFDLPTI